MDILNYLTKKQKEILDISAKNLGEALKEVSKASLEVSPIRTGRLRKSYKVIINKEVIGRGNSDKTLIEIPGEIKGKEDLTGEIVVDAESDNGFRYPLYVHEVGSRTGERFFLQRPFEESKKRIIDSILLRGND